MDNDPQCLNLFPKYFIQRLDKTRNIAVWQVLLAMLWNKQLC